MKQLVLIFSLIALINCEKMEDSSSFKDEYPREICD